jgi:hypothetical protein
MNKLTWRIPTAGVSAALAGGALLATGSSATAATAQTQEHTYLRAAAVEGRGGAVLHGYERWNGRRFNQSQTARNRPDAWVAGQPAAAATHSWIADQLTLFASHHVGNEHLAND